MFVPLSRPDISTLEKRYVTEVLESGQLSLGPKLREFEQRCASLAQKKYAAAVNSGTSALHLAVKILGLKEGDEVITTPYSFIASSNCLLYERVKPVFIDIDEHTLNMDAEKLEDAITEKTKAILVVHVFGQPADMERIGRIAKKYQLKVIEDACEAIGAKWDGQPAGSFGDVSVFAFYPNKQITTGEGGVLMTDDEAGYRAACSYRNQGRSDSGNWLEHVRIGYNYRMSDLQAAVGLAQIERLNELLERRERAAERYKQYIREYEVEVDLPKVSARAHMSWFVFVVMLPETANRQEVMRLLSENGIQTRPYFPSIHLQPAYRALFGYKPGDLPVCEKQSERTLAIPFYPGIGEEEQKYVIRHLKKAVERSKSR